MKSLKVFSLAAALMLGTAPAAFAQTSVSGTLDIGAGVDGAVGTTDASGAVNVGAGVNAGVGEGGVDLSVDANADADVNAGTQGGTGVTGGASGGANAGADATVGSGTGGTGASGSAGADAQGGGTVSSGGSGTATGSTSSGSAGGATGAGTGATGSAGGGTSVDAGAGDTTSQGTISADNLTTEVECSGVDLGAMLDADVEAIAGASTVQIVRLNDCDDVATTVGADIESAIFDNKAIATTLDAEGVVRGDIRGITTANTMVMIYVDGDEDASEAD